MTVIPQVMTVEASSPTMTSLTTSKAFTGLVESLGVSLLQIMNSTSVTVQERITHTTIDDLSAFGFQVLKPIPVEIEYYTDDEFVASWPEAGAAITSDSATGSIQALKFEIVESYEIFKKENHLGAELQQQLVVLEEYLGAG